MAKVRSSQANFVHNLSREVSSCSRVRAEALSVTLHPLDCWDCCYRRE
jgi:hypothetical protein